MCVLTMTVFLLYSTINVEVKNLPEHGKIYITRKNLRFFCKNITLDYEVFFQILGSCHLDTFSIKQLMPSPWATKINVRINFQSVNWFLARRCSAIGKAAGSAGVKHQGVFGGQIFPIASAPLGKELFIKELEFLFLVPGMKIAGLLFNLLQLFGWGVRFHAGRSWLYHSSSLAKPNQNHSGAEWAMLSAFCRQNLVPKQLFMPCPFARCSWNHQHQTHWDRHWAKYFTVVVKWVLESASQTLQLIL